MQTIGDREPLHGELGRFYDAIENPRKTRGELPILRDAELRTYLADVRERTLEVLAEVDISAEAEDPLLREGFVYEMLLAHELQHNETMLQLLQLVDGYESALIDGAPAFEPPRLRTGDAHAPCGRVRGRRSRARLRLRQRAPSPPGRAGGLRDRSNPGLQSHVCRFHGGDRRRAAAVLGARRRHLGEHRDGAAGAARPRAIPSSMSPGNRRTPSPAGPASGCRASSSGRRRSRAWRESAAVGSGPARTSSPTRASRPFPTRSTPRSSSVTSTRCCAAAPGRRTRASSARASATGTCRSAVRSSPACAARGTHDRDRGPPRRRCRRDDGA